MKAKTAFREVVRELEARGALATVSRQVDPKHELTAVMRQMQKGENKALLFRSVAGSDQQVVTNVFGFRSHVASALGLDEADLLSSLVQLENQRLPTERVDQAPVQEVVVTGADVDVARDIPQVVFSELDAGAYLTAGVLIAPHPETGVYNASWNRCQLVGGDRMRVRMMPPQHLGRYHQVAEEKGQNLPCAIVIGAPPGVMFSAASKVPFEVDELEVAGAWQGSPLRVTRCKTIPVDVPADAEMVIEGEVIAGVREDEGPFGEFTDGYVPVMKNHVFRVTAITRRRDAIYHAILAGGTEDLNLVGVPIQTEIYKKVSSFVPRIRDIATPGYVFGCVISIEKKSEDQSKNAVLAALAAYSWTKVVVVVDEDVNPFDAADVLWAIQTRATPDTGVYVFPHVPSYTREDVREVHRGKIGIDATVPMHMKKLFERRRFPGESEVRLEEYIDGGC
ncbi:UbiD family decarboxylase [Rhodopseudomonas julia]|uniref:UbiD family decarboxylase n=1 Tax=Rhodopseudomonas julia TaxID=200617 RepID=A0ABU0C5U1_9BRAD|nr:UbiD family decarboxylase [Rhodopseudomonas julia]MDQ0325886.1 UbiD family decarboxylase [Rhodopseudomonas julia]